MSSRQGPVFVLIVVAAAALGWYGGVRSQNPLVQAEITRISIPEANPERIARKFGDLYWQKQIHFNNTWWLGVQTLQVPADMWTFQQILYEIRPDYIVETGTWHGGSALFMSMVLEQVHPSGKIISIDLDPVVEEASRYKAFRDRVEAWKGSSTDPAMVKRVTERTRGKRTMVFLDSNHARAHVAKELELYHPLVTLNSFLIVHDTNLYGDGPPPIEGPGAAVEDFLAKHPEFQVDRSREVFMTTFSSKGYLRKVPR